MTLPPLRPYQLRAIERGSEAIAGGANAVLFCMPTGTGKTRLAVEICLRHVRNVGGIPLWIAPRRELVSQGAATLESAGLEPGHDCFVRSIQALLASAELPRGITLVVLDEARHYVADEWGLIRKMFPDAIIVGLDATPERGDGRGLGGLFDVIIEPITIREAIELKFLVPPETFRPERALLANELARDPLDAYLEKAPGSSAVVFCRDVAHAKELAERFAERGVSAAAIWGEMREADRDNVLDLFARGEIKVLTNMHVLTEGWDAPITDCVILARHFPTPGGMIQATGRGARPHPGKKSYKLIDLTGCTHVHGEPDEPRTWHLHGRASTRLGAPLADDVRFCPVCGGVAAAGAPCPSCGYDGDERRKRKPRILGLAIDRFARQRQESDEQKAKKLAFYLSDARRQQHHIYRAMKRFEGVYGHMPTPAIKRLARSLG